MKVGKITDEIKQQIIDLNDLREVAEDYGIEFNSTGKAQCPFHKDGKNGNLHLHEKRGEHSTYHCYQETCSAGTMWADAKKTKRHILTLPDGTEIEDGGPNVIGFVMNIEQVSYVEACVILMNRAGIPVPEGKVDYKKQRYKERIHSLNIDYCKTLYKTPEVMSYLKERGIMKPSIKKWRLGYVPEEDTRAPLGKKASGRLVFGLAEESYNTKNALTVAMAYRTLKGEEPKYYNDFTTEGIYEKKNYLYGLNEARKAIRSAGYAIIMEGYMDVIMSHQSGVENAVAVCGTSFTIEQMEKLKRMTKNLVFWLDGDSAGMSSMLQDIPTLLEMGFRVKIVIAPGKDPAEWMVAMDQDKMKVLEFISEHARPALQVIAEQVIDEYEEETKTIRTMMESKINEKLLDALDELLPILDTVKDPSERIVFRMMIEKKLGVRV